MSHHREHPLVHNWIQLGFSISEPQAEAPELEEEDIVVEGEVLEKIEASRIPVCCSEPAVLAAHFLHPATSPVFQNEE